MSFNIGLSYPAFKQTSFNKNITPKNAEASPAENQYKPIEEASNNYNNKNIMNMLDALAMQNGYIPGLNKDGQNFSRIAKMLQAGNKEDVKDMAEDAVPYLTAISKAASQPLGVRVDAIATLAKLVEEGKAPISCLIALLKDSNCKDMAERALANIGKEALPAVEQLLNGSDPELRQSAINILNDMKDAWTGYENDPKWGTECKELMPAVDELLEKVNK